jgi:hypothetical protein
MRYDFRRSRHVNDVINRLARDYDLVSLQCPMHKARCFWQNAVLGIGERGV